DWNRHFVQHRAKNRASVQRARRVLQGPLLTAPVQLANEPSLQQSYAPIQTRITVMKIRLALSLFLAVFATATLLAADSAAKRDDSASEKLGMKLSLQCYTYRALSFFETVDKAVVLGIKYLEIYPGQKVKPGSTN